jgi:hypothetical protein
LSDENKDYSDGELSSAKIYESYLDAKKKEKSRGRQEQDKKD